VLGVRKKLKKSPARMNDYHARKIQKGGWEPQKKKKAEKKRHQRGMANPEGGRPAGPVLAFGPEIRGSRVKGEVRETARRNIHIIL